MPAHENNRKILELPFPTENQVNNFIDRITRCLDWHRRLHLIDGGQFSFFLSDKLPVDYPVEQYGYLDFNCKFLPVPPHNNWELKLDKQEYNGFFSIDNFNLQAEIPKKLLDVTQVKLYPYLADHDSTITVSSKTNKEAMEKIVAGHTHPQSELIIEWYQLLFGNKNTGDGYFNIDRIFNICDQLRETQKLEIKNAIKRMEDWLLKARNQLG